MIGEQFVFYECKLSTLDECLKLIPFIDEVTNLSSLYGEPFDLLLHWWAMTNSIRSSTVI